MDYKKTYNKIIENRKMNPPLDNQYGEKHHIIPRSLGGIDDESNLVKLSAREHFICHALLAEMYDKNSFEWYKMNHAFMMMKSEAFNQNRYINNRLYELKKKDFSDTMSYSQSGPKNSQYGTKKSFETKKKQRESLLKTLGISDDGLTYRERNKLKSKIDKHNYTINGIFINKQRRNMIKKMFNIDFENRCEDAFLELKELLNRLYVIENKSTLSIAEMLNTNDETIRNYLSFVGIDRKKLSEAIKNYNTHIVA
jgi:hypothetical protein